MAGAKARARLRRVACKAGGGAGVGNLAGSAVGNRRGKAIDIHNTDTNSRSGCEGTSRHIGRRAAFHCAAGSPPGGQPAVQNRDICMPEQPQHPPGARRCLDVGVIIDDDMITFIHTKCLQGVGKGIWRGYHMRHGVRLVGNGVDIEPLRTGDMRGAEFGSGVALHRWQVAAGIKYTHGVKIGCEPFGGYKNGSHDQSSSQDGTGRSFSRRNAGFQTFDW